jgi:hypothetical protein
MKHLVLVALAVVGCNKSESLCSTAIEKEIACDPALTEIAKDKLRNGEVHLCRDSLDGGDQGPFTKVGKQKWEHEIECAQKNATCDAYAACKDAFDLAAAMKE